MKTSVTCQHKHFVTVYPAPSDDVRFDHYGQAVLLETVNFLYDHAAPLHEQLWLGRAINLKKDGMPGLRFFRLGPQPAYKLSPSVLEAAAAAIAGFRCPETAGP